MGRRGPLPHLRETGKPEPTNDLAGNGAGRYRARIKFDTILPRHRCETSAIEIIDQFFRRGQLASFDPVGIADPSWGFFLRAMQEHREHLAVILAQDRFELFIIGPIVRLAIRRDQQWHAVLSRCMQGYATGGVHQLPEAGHAEIEDGARQIDVGVIVHQPRRYQAQQLFRDG